MQNFLTIAISNTVMACVLALLAVYIGRVRRNPQMSHALWLLVLVKLVTPPLADVPLPEFLSLEAASNEGDTTSSERATQPVNTAKATIGETAHVEMATEAEMGTWLLEAVGEVEPQPAAIIEESLSTKTTHSPISKPIPDSTPILSAEPIEKSEPNSPAQPLSLIHI